MSLQNLRWLVFLTAVINIGVSLANDPAAPITVEPMVLNPPQHNLKVRKAASLLADPNHALGSRLIDLGKPPLQAKAQSFSHVPRQIGYSRDVPELKNNADTNTRLDWKPVKGGIVGSFAIRSSGAEALRIGVRIDAIPDTAEVRFFSKEATEVEVVSGNQITETVQRNLDAGDPEQVGRIFWSPVISGDTAGLEIFLPSGSTEAEVIISAPKVSHIFESPNQSSSFLAPRASANCEIDAMCVSGGANRSVARITFVSGQYSYLCTGTLLNDQAGDQIPYFLTANHCINSQSSASSITTYWFYNSSSCNSGALNSGAVSQSAGAQLLYNSSSTDASFLKLNTPPPAGVSFSGWTTATPGVNTSTSISVFHNPMGDMQKFSSGSISGYSDCTLSGSGTFSCSGSTSGSSTFLQVTFSQGITEGGSSGSGIFALGGYLVGQLYGGSNSCSYPYFPDYYGRFDKTYQNGNLGLWLASQSKQNQTISFGSAPIITVGVAGTLSATATSSLPVTFSTMTAGTCTVNGTTVTGVSSGLCTVAANQVGNSNYNAAPQVTQSITVGKSTQSISLSTPSSVAPGATASVSATATSGLPVTLASTTPSVCSVSGSTVTGKGVGTCTITASQAGNTSFNAAATVNRSFPVVKSDQTISLTPISNLTVGSSLMVSASATSGLPVTLASTTPSVCSVSGSTVTGKGVGTCTITASQAGNTSFNAAATVNQSIAVYKRPQQITFAALAAINVGGIVSASASASSGLPITFSSLTPSICSVSTNRVTGLLAGTCSIAANQAGNTTFSSAAQVNQSFAVTKLSQTLVLTVPASITRPATGTVSASASSGLAVMLSSSTPSICSISGNKVTGKAAGICTISAVQAGNSMYNATGPISKNITTK